MIDWDDLTKRFAEYAATVTADQYFADMHEANPDWPPLEVLLRQLTDYDPRHQLVPAHSKDQGAQIIILVCPIGKLSVPRLERPLGLATGASAASPNDVRLIELDHAALDQVPWAGPRFWIIRSLRSAMEPTYQAIIEAQEVLEEDEQRTIEAKLIDPEGHEASLTLTPFRPSGFFRDLGELVGAWEQYTLQITIN